MLDREDDDIVEDVDDDGDDEPELEHDPEQEHADVPRVDDADGALVLVAVAEHGVGGEQGCTDEPGCGGEQAGHEPEGCPVGDRHHHDGVEPEQQAAPAPPESAPVQEGDDPEHRDEREVAEYQLFEHPRLHGDAHVVLVHQACDQHVGAAALDDQADQQGHAQAPGEQWPNGGEDLGDGPPRPEQVPGEGQIARERQVHESGDDAPCDGQHHHADEVRFLPLLRLVELQRGLNDIIHRRATVRGHSAYLTHLGW